MEFQWKVRDITEEVCSFANAAGGYVLIGVDDHGVVKGTTIDNSKRSAIQDSFSPAAMHHNQCIGSWTCLQRMNPYHV